MRPRGAKRSVGVPTGQACVVLVSTDVEDLQAVGDELQQLGGRLVAFNRVEDLQYNPPAGRVVLTILAASGSLQRLSRALSWLRTHRPRCSVLVVGDTGCDRQERVARGGGALYMVRPVSAAQWRAVLEHALPAGVRTSPAAGRIDK